MHAFGIAVFKTPGVDRLSVIFFHNSGRKLNTLCLSF